MGSALWFPKIPLPSLVLGRILSIGTLLFMMSVLARLDTMGVRVSGGCHISNNNLRSAACKASGTKTKHYKIGIQTIGWGIRSEKNNWDYIVNTGTSWWQSTYLVEEFSKVYLKIFKLFCNLGSLGKYLSLMNYQIWTCNQFQPMKWKLGLRVDQSR